MRIVISKNQLEYTEITFLFSSSYSLKIVLGTTTFYCQKDMKAFKEIHIINLIIFYYQNNNLCKWQYRMKQRKPKNLNKS